MDNEKVKEAVKKFEKDHPLVKVLQQAGTYRSTVFQGHKLLVLLRIADALEKLSQK